MTDKAKILIVDDEPLARDVMEGFLFRDNYDMAFAARGAEALAYFESSPPDLMLLDVMMPEMDGYTVCQKLKSDERFRHIPIILVTALGSKEDLVRGFEAGADDFLAKPVNEPELRARVRSMLRIKKQHDELEAALRLREDLSHMIVHDMRSPLTAIMGFSGMLQMRNRLSPEDLEDVNKIYAYALRVNSFLNDMLMIAKMEKAGHLILHYSTVDINKLVQRVIENHQIVTQLKRISLVTDLPIHSPQKSLDQNLFERVVDNLLSNALKFSPPQSTVRIEVKCLESADPSLSEPGIRLRILDQGPGIAKEHRQHIFNKFEILELQQNKVVQVGLGLALCKMVVDSHGGRIFVEDNDPVGAVFTVEV
jgi:signal transduction histidine kinase